MALHVIPCSAVSSAVTLVSPTMPCFAATYADLNADATKPCAEAMLMMRPHLLRSIDGKANRVVWKADDRLMAKIASHFSGGKCCNEATCWIPALLTRMSSRPNICSVCSIISRIAAGFDISAGENDTRTLKSEAILACTSAISSGLPKPLRTISEPAAAKALAMPRPIPLVDPVTSDTLPASTSRAAMFSGLMAMFMARSYSGWMPQLPLAPICRRQAMHRQCLLANDLIQYGYGNPSGLILLNRFLGHIRRNGIVLHQSWSARWPRIGPHLSWLDAGPGNRRSVAVAARAVAHVFQSSDRRNG